MPFSATMLPPILVALWYKENTISDFCAATATTLTLGIILWFPFRKQSRELQAREAFLIVALLWLALAVTGAFPFAFSENAPISSYIDAVFETISGLTTTGATVFSNLDQMPRSILYYRQQLQFIGGGGIIVLSIAILPLLGVGGMQLFRAEIPGPFKEDKLTPRITQTAKTLWLIYVGLVVVCALCYWLAGLSLFDAIGYSFSTISSGGFCTHDDNFNSLHNPILEWLCVIFMLLGAINFSLHFSALRRRSLLHYWQDPECKAYFKLWFFIIVLISGALFYYHVFDNVNTTMTKSVFQTTSFLTTTGFFSDDFSHWPTFTPFLLMFICLLGGCAGSTAGGIKIIRLLVLKKQGAREIQRLIHPNGYYVIKFGYNRLSHRTLDAIVGFFCIFVATFILLLLLLLALGLDAITAFSCLTASISNTGLKLSTMPDNFKLFSEPVKIVISIAMLAGRLELFTLFVLLTPHYWRY
jgi:trk system potassium uptake protein TrkH